MRASLLVFCLLLLAANCKLIYLFSMIRHGAIYPKNDLYDGNETKAYRGQLTSIGQRQQYNLGTYLQQDYITTAQLTTPRFNPAQVEFYASTYQRTQASALAFLYGIFPLEQGWVIPDGVTADKFNPPYTPLFPAKLRSESEAEFALNRGFQAMPVQPLDNILDNCPNYDDLLVIRKREVAAKTALL